MNRSCLVVLLVLTQVCGCRAGAAAAELSLRRLRPDAPAYTLNSALGEPTQLVLQNQQDLTRLWPRITGASRPSADVPVVDFAREVVVVVALGRQRSGGYAVQIDRVEQRGDAAVVHARATVPGRGCIVSSAVTSPVDVALLRKPTGAVVVEVETVSTDCRWGFSPATRQAVP